MRVRIDPTIKTKTIVLNNLNKKNNRSESEKFGCVTFDAIISDECIE